MSYTRNEYAAAAHDALHEAALVFTQEIVRVDLCKRAWLREGRLP